MLVTVPKVHQPVEVEKFFPQVQLSVYEAFMVRRRVDYEDEQNRESLFSGVKFFAITGVTTFVIGYLSGLLLLEVSSFFFLLVTVAFLLIFLDGHLQPFPAENHI